MTHTISRRRFLKGLLGGALAVSLPPLYAAHVEPEWLAVLHTSITLPSLPPAWDGLTLVQLSDIHLGSGIELDTARRAVSLANAAAPDLVVLTGDFVTGEARHSREVAAALAELRSRYGSYAVLGNHDIWTDAAVIAANLEDAGISVLRDRRVALEHDGARLWLLGIEDTGSTAFSSPRGRGDCAAFRAAWAPACDSLAGLLGDISPDEPRLLLVHNPDFTEMLPEGRVDLALCGHTHGGQVQLPLVGAPFVPSCFGQKFVEGWVQGATTQVYVNRGLGTTGLALRFNCRPEVTVLRIES